jgi:RNA polymerase sigma-70 factor (ECF subfamily)
MMRDIEQLYQDHGPAMLSYVRRTFGWCASAEDVLQETFLQALRRPRDLQEAVSPRAYLFGIARHIGQTAARRHRPTASLESIDARPAKVNDALADVRRAIAELSPTLREPLELRLREQMTYEEIAKVLEIPLGTVRSRLHNAVRQLRQTMQ